MARIRLRNGAQVSIEGFHASAKNTATDGGAIATSSGGALTISNSSFTGNRTDYSAGAIYARRRNSQHHQQQLREELRSAL